MAFAQGGPIQPLVDPLLIKIRLNYQKHIIIPYPINIYLIVRSIKHHD